MRRIAAAMIGMFALAAADLVPTPAVAQPWRDGGYGEAEYRRGPQRDDRRWRERRGWGRHDQRGDGYDGRRRYDRDDDRGRRPPGRRGRRCRDDGTGGTIIGAIAGGLLGNGVAGRGDRTLGTILGGGAGALAGRAIDRDCR